MQNRKVKNADLVELVKGALSLLKVYDTREIKLTENGSRKKGKENLSFESENFLSHPESGTRSITISEA